MCACLCVCLSMAELPRCDGRGHIGAHSTIEFVKLAQHIAELPLLHATARRHAKVKSVLTKIIINKQTQYQNKKNIFYGKQPPLKRGKVIRHERTKKGYRCRIPIKLASKLTIHTYACTHAQHHCIPQLQHVFDASRWRRRVPNPYAVR